MVALVCRGTVEECCVVNKKKPASCLMGDVLTLFSLDCCGYNKHLHLTLEVDEQTTMPCFLV